MKKIIAFLILLLCLKQSYAQYPLKQYLGSDSTLVTVRGGMNARVVLWSFTDTTQANTQRINQYAGALIYTTGTDKVWYRNSTATGWIEFTSSGGTTTNIYNSDGFITGTRVLDLSASPLTFSRSGVKQFAAEDNLTTIGSPNNQKRITVYNDSITILGLSQTTDTTTYKPLAIDGNGYFTIMDRWPGGGGSTPTLQQVLTAGSTLTGNNTINLDLFEFEFTNDPIAGVDANFGVQIFSGIGVGSSIFDIGNGIGPGGGGQIRVLGFDESVYSEIVLDTAFIRMGQTQGNLFIDTLNYTLSTTGKKILIRDTATGLVQNIDPSLLGGGSTPTLQQVLTAGSTLTQNNTIEGGTYNLKFNANNIWDVDSARQWRLRSFRAADSSMQLISSSPSFASSIKRLTMQSQDSQYKSWNIIDYDHITNEVYTRPGAEFLQSGNYLDENGFSIIKYDGSESNNSLNIFELIGDSSRTAKRISYTSNINGTLTDYSLTTKKYVDSVAVLGGGSYTFTNGLTESGGTVKLGGDLVNSTSINGKGSYSVTLDSLTGFTVKSPGLTKILTTSTQAYIYGNSSSTYMGVGTELFLAQQKSGNSISMSSDSFVLKMGGNSQLIIRPDSLNINPPLGIAIIDTLAAASNMTNKRVMTWDTVTKRWEQISPDSVGKKFGVEDVTASADRAFNLNNNKLDLDSGSFHIKAKVTSPRSDDIFSVGIGGNKSLYVTQIGDVYATQLYAGSGSFYTLGGLIAMNSSTIRLNGTSTFNSFQKKFEFIHEYPALLDSTGAEFKNDTLGISTLPDTWSNTYKILSLKYRSGVDNSLNNRYDFFGNGQPRFYMFGDSSFLDTPVTIAGFDADGNMIEVLPSSLGGGGADGNNYPTSVGYTQSSRTLTIVRNGLADITTTLPEATTSLAGLLAGADKSFLDSLRAGQIIDTSYYGLISGPSNHDSAFVYWIPYSESNVDSSFMFLVPKYSGTVSSGTQYRLGYYAATGATISQAAAITASRALVSDANGVPTHATTTATELGYVSGVTSAIQTQIDGKISASSTNTLTNKRWTARVGSTTSSATPTINTDNYDIYKLTAQTADITSFTTNLTGTPNDGDILEIQITGTAARAITWGASFVASTVALPTTTVTTATLTVVFQYYTTSSYGNNKWVCVNSY